MASLNVFIVTLLIAFVVGTRGDVVVVDRKCEMVASIPVLTTELERLSSYTSKLEMILEEKNHNLSAKNNLIAERDKESEGQSQAISSLQNMIEALQQKESGDTNMQVAKAYARIRELERQVQGLKESIRKQKQERKYFKLRADESEKTAKEQMSKYEKMEYIVSEQWVSIQQTEQALHIAKEFMLKAKKDAAAKTDDLVKAYKGWLPSWVGVHLLELQRHVASNWLKHADPIMNLLREKTSTLLLLLLFGFFILYSSIFGVSKKIDQSGHTCNTRRKPNRRHPKK